MKRIKIDKNIPVAPRGGGKGYEWPWDDMNVGDSFFYSDEDRLPKVIQSSMTVSAGHYRKSVNKDFRIVTRTSIEGGVKGIRVWRIQ